jgi:hypothetical protein
MKIERRQPTRAEWQRITSKRPVVRRYPKPQGSPGRRAQARRPAPRRRDAG